MTKNFWNIFRFVMLLLIQVAILNNINFGGYINPQIYIIYVILFPYYHEQRSYLILSSFFLGISVDFFMNSGGINAFATTLIAFLRQNIFEIIMGKQNSENKIEIRELPFSKWFSYLLITTLIHHTALFWMENFSFNELGQMAVRIVFSTISTTGLILLTLSLFLRRH